ncbi:glycosyltransferase family protein [Arthrobacter caoxuetaonis]|uniref:glycosyltransferase family protein n=1 Tax=Arthrobacter caoxuetaonis TaxID=2886935 RepID=UPI001D14CD4B|nr:glycosyltransferase [Arthrobacter caoxuetaonis]MCC3282470.1 glycosyltransferase [Arthrobacter caoxuetaonis]
MSAYVTELRRSLWHLRKSGWRGLQTKTRRDRAERGIYRGSASGALGFQTGRRRQLSFNPMVVEDPETGSGITAAVILDDFSLLAFGYEWKQILLSRRKWAEQLADERPDLLFVESAWSGNNGEWKHQLTGTNGPSADLRALVAACRDMGIPTVFWNKEDPPHYGDFLETARLFDYVFTSDSNRLPSYRKDLGHDRVAVLQFAAQPVIHNPVRPRHGWHQRDVAFAGMYFAHKYPERREQMDILLGAAQDAGAKMPKGLEIFARHGDTDPNYRFPAPYDERVVGSLTYDRMLTAYKAFKVFLNVNSVVDSPSMCARRIFEITAAGTTVVSTPSAALTQLWEPEEQFIVETREEAAHTLTALVRNPELSGRQLHLAQRRIWAEHTYAHRAETILRSALPDKTYQVTSLPSVSLLVSSNRPHQLEHVFRTAGSFVGPDVELVLLTHGFRASRASIAGWKETYGVSNLVLLEQPADVPLGECLNLCAAASQGDVLSKMDDDDFYGPHYLLDMVNALKYSRADVVGKQAHFMYLARRDATLLRFPEREHRFTNMVMGPTITAPRQRFLETPFRPLPRGEDSAFLGDIIAGGGTVYSSDKYNYFQFRGSVNHAWQVSDAELLTSGDIQFFGSPEEHVLI